MALGVAPAQAVADRRGRVYTSNFDELDYFTSKPFVADPYPSFDHLREVTRSVCVRDHPRGVAVLDAADAMQQAET